MKRLINKIMKFYPNYNGNYRSFSMP